MTKTPMTWMHMLEPFQRAHTGTMPMEVWTAHGWPASLPDCRRPDLGGHPENEPLQPPCPSCDSPHLDCGFHFATQQHDLEGEVAHCRACGWAGESEESQPFSSPSPCAALSPAPRDRLPSACREMSMILETKFLHLRRPAAMGDMVAHGWRVCWRGGWDKGRVFFLVMVVRKIAATHAGMPTCR